MRDASACDATRLEFWIVGDAQTLPAREGGRVDVLCGTSDAAFGLSWL